jgi:diguanylate cyclase (GGDEF)-like protein
MLTAVVGVIVGLQVGGLAAQSEGEQTWHERVLLAHDLEQVRYYDEVLTTSARMAASTGDRSYQVRYDKAVPELEAVLQHALSLANDDARREIAKTDDANAELVAIETESFERLGRGDRQGAYRLLTSKRYEEAKAEYSNGLSDGLALIDAAVREKSQQAHELQVGALVADAAAALLLALMWLATARCLRADQRPRTHMEEQLRRQAQRDPLTGLANRRLFRDRLSTALAVARDHPVAVLFADLDGFNEVNDTRGHASGDSVLIEVAERMQALLRGHVGALAARLGGDEFALLLLDGDTNTAEELARRLVASLAQPYAGAHGVPITASVGIASTHDEAGDPTEVLRGADLAMHQVKIAGSNRYARYADHAEAAVGG